MDRQSNEKELKAAKSHLSNRSRHDLSTKNAFTRTEEEDSPISSGIQLSTFPVKIADVRWTLNGSSHGWQEDTR